MKKLKRILISFRTDFVAISANVVCLSQWLRFKTKITKYAPINPASVFSEGKNDVSH